MQQLLHLTQARSRRDDAEIARGSRRSRPRSAQAKTHGGWVGSSLIHLGDSNVPNALMFINKYSQAHLILRPRELERTYLLTHVTLRWSTSSTRYSRRSRRSARCMQRMPICADGSTRRSAGPTRCAGTSSPTSSGAIRRDLARSGSSRRISANIRRSQVRVRRLGCGQLLRRGVVHRRPAHLRVELVLAGTDG